MGVNSLPKTVTRQRRDCNLNPGPSAPESSMLLGYRANLFRNIYIAINILNTCASLTLPAVSASVNKEDRPTVTHYIANSTDNSLRYININMSDMMETKDKIYEYMLIGQSRYELDPQARHRMQPDNRPTSE